MRLHRVVSAVGGEEGGEAERKRERERERKGKEANFGSSYIVDGS